MKELTIVYGGVKLFDGPVSEFVWTDSDTSVAVKGTLPQASAGGALGGLLNALVTGSQRQTAEMAESKRATYELEKQ